MLFESRMVSYSHFLRTVFGLWNQGWQAIPTFWGQYMSFEIKDGKLFPPSEDSMGSLTSRMASYSHFLEQYLVFEIEDASYSHFLRSVCDLISKHGWLLAAVGFWGKKMSGWGVEGSVVVLLILALLLILPLILLLVVLPVLLMVRGWGQHGRTQESQVSLGSHEGRGLLSSSVGMF